MKYAMDYISEEDLRCGIRRTVPDGDCCCLFCDAVFHQGEIYPEGTRFFTHEVAAKRHVESTHGGAFSAHMQLDAKSLGLSEGQKRLLALVHAGLADKEIAQQLGLSPSTVRHQRFTLREKEKQARMFLCVYHLAQRKRAKVSDPIPVHANATMVDARYETTQEEAADIIRQAFSSLSPLRLKTFPSKEKKKLVVLQQIAAQFRAAQSYSEKEVNEILAAIYTDYVTIRRYLIEYGFLTRTRDGAAYWRSSTKEE